MVGHFVLLITGDPHTLPGGEQAARAQTLTITIQDTSLEVKWWQPGWGPENEANFHPLLFFSVNKLAIVS